MKHIPNPDLVTFFGKPGSDINEFDDRTLASLVGVEAATDKPNEALDEFINRKFRTPYRSGGSR